MINSIKKFKPVTPSLRHKVVTIKPSRKERIKKLSISLKKKGGRNNTGRITIRHRGGEHKRQLRKIDEIREQGKYSESRLINREYDPNRTSFIGRYLTKKYKMYYTLAGLKDGKTIRGKKSQGEKTYEWGDTLKLKDIPVGSKIYNIDTSTINRGKKRGTHVSKSAGSYSVLLSKTMFTSTIRLPSKKLIEVDVNNYATIGQVSHDNNKLTILGSAGSARRKGIRPTVRGYAMNPVDHPQGGKTHGGMQPKTKWGKQAKWVKKKKML